MFTSVFFTNFIHCLVACVYKINPDTRDEIVNKIGIEERREEVEMLM